MEGSTEKEVPKQGQMLLTECLALYHLKHNTSCIAPVQAWVLSGRVFIGQIAGLDDVVDTSH